jgi:hypothetical protein
MKRLTMSEFLNFGQKQMKNDKNRSLFEMEDMNSTIYNNKGPVSMTESEVSHLEDVNDMLWGKGKNINVKSLIPERIQTKKAVNLDLNR